MRRRKSRKKKKRKRNHKQAGTAFRSLLSFFCIKHLQNREEERARTRERERDEDAEERKKSENIRKYRTWGKGLKQTKRTDQPSRFQRRCNFFTSVPRSVLFTSRTMHFFAFCLHFTWTVTWSLCMHFTLFIERTVPLFVSNRVTCLGKWPGRTYWFQLFFFWKK